MSNFSVDNWLAKTYNHNRYHCGHFVNDVYYAITGIRLDGIVAAFLSGHVGNYRSLRRFRKRIKKPESPCIVLIHNGNASHAGIFYNDKLLHLTEQGVRYESLEFARGFKMTFYK